MRYFAGKMARVFFLSVIATVLLAGFASAAETEHDIKARPGAQHGALRENKEIVGTGRDGEHEAHPGKSEPFGGGHEGILEVNDRSILSALFLPSLGRTA